MRKCIQIKSYRRRDGTEVKGYERCFDLKAFDETKQAKLKSITDKLSGKLSKSTEAILKDPNVDSLTYYQQNPSKEREEIYKKAEQDVFHEKASKEKVMYMLGGATANGKSTYLESDVSEVPEDVVTIDPDSLKGYLPEYEEIKKSKQWKKAAKEVHEESSELSKRFLSKALGEGYKTVLDGIGDGGIEKLANKIAGYKAKGHKVVANYMSLDTELSVKLAKMRAEKTKRYVPIAYVRYINSEVSKIVPQALERKLYDKFTLWDTNEQGKPKKIVSFENGTTKIESQELWEKFLLKGGKRNYDKYRRFKG